jgi:hypothetical protein
MNTALILAVVTTAFTAVSAQAMGAGQNPLPQATAVHASAIDTAAIGQRSCRAVPVAGTQQIAGGARGSCLVVAQAAAVVGGGLRTRTLMTRGHTLQALRVASAD